jgi:hypothetical protein
MAHRICYDEAVRLGSTVAGILSMAALHACALDRAGLGETAGRDAGTDGGSPLDASGPARDGAPPDVAPLDAPPGDDAGSPDAGPPDAGPPDVGPPDTGPPDSGPPDAGPRPTCRELYGGVGGYYRCQETATTCEFYTNPSGSQSCDAVCAAGGGTCLDAWRELYPCGHREDRTCGFAMDDMICLCTR